MENEYTEKELHDKLFELKYLQNFAKTVEEHRSIKEQIKMVHSHISVLLLKNTQLERQGRER